MSRLSGFASVAEATNPAALSGARRWMITGTVMLVTIMQVLDVTVTNVALPHIQGSLSAGVDEVSWVLTSYLAANAVVLPATGWLAGLFGRRRFFLICTVVFTAASVLCGPFNSDCDFGVCPEGLSCTADFDHFSCACSLGPPSSLAAEEQRD